MKILRNVSSQTNKMRQHSGKERTGEEFLMQTDKPAKEHKKWGHCYVASLICSSSAQAP